ncbi:MAG TPA: FtsX-like permease family protein [Streptosporangiaceae bacterium]|nr:FtsX-like permease family protein [Streptosporangiaceae bacterium]
MRRRLASWLSAAAGTGIPAAVTLGLLAGVTMFAAVAGPRQSLGVRTRALQRMFATATAAQRSVQATADWQTVENANGGPLALGQVTTATGQIAQQLAAAHLPMAPAAADWTALTTAYNPLLNPPASAISQPGAVPQIELTFRDSLTRNSRLVAGHYPGQAGRGLQVAVTQATAARFGLHPGSRLTLSLPGGTTVLLVTGIIRPSGPRSTFWTLDPDAAAPTIDSRGRGSDSLTYWAGAAFAGPAGFARLQTIFGSQDLQLLWDYPLNLAGLTADQVQPLEDDLLRAAAQAGSLIALFSPAVNSGLIGSLAAFASTQAAIEPVLSLLFIGLTVIGAVVVWLAAWMLAERRGAEYDLMRARGASLRQLAAVALRGAALVILPAAAAGAAAAVAVTPGGGDPLAWWLGAVALLAALAGPAWIAARRHRTVDLAPDRVLERAASRRTALRRWVAEATLVAACVAGLIVLRQQGLPEVGGVDVYTGAAPVLAAVPAALIILRLSPPVLRGLLRLATPRAGAAGFVGLATAARAAISATLPAFALVLALAMAAFGGMVGTAVHRGEVAASWRTAGADAVVSAPQGTIGITPTAARAIAAVPGVQRTAEAYVTGTTVNSGSPVQAAAVDPARYAALVAATPWPALPRGLPERATPPGRPVPAIASPSAAAQLGSGPVQIPIGNGQLMIKVVARLSSTPALPGVSAFVLLPLWAVQRTPFPPPPTLMLVTGQNLDEAALSAAVRRTTPGASVSYRSAVLAGLSGAPLQHAAGEFFTEGVAVAAVLAAVTLLLGLGMGARARARALARLRVLGLGRGQSRVMLAAQLLPQVIGAVAGGLLCAVLLAPLIGPDLDLSVFTGSSVSVPVRPDYLSLALPAAGLLVLALAALAIQSALTSRASAALRTDI